MGISYDEEQQEFYLYNKKICYIMKVMKNQQLGQLYFGKKITGYQSFEHLTESTRRSMTSYVFEGDMTFSLENIRQEFPSSGTTDYRFPCVGIRQENGSRITDFKVEGYEILEEKPGLSGLPATYTEAEGEASTLKIVLRDQVTGVKAELLYTIFEQEDAVAKSVRFMNEGTNPVELDIAMSLCMDLPDSDYELLQLSGSWGRERHIKYRKLEQGILSVGSLRGHSSPHHNPFIALKRQSADEFQGEVLGFHLVYSGNFLAQVEVDTYDTARVLMGIHPHDFTWYLEAGESFQTPEAVMVYSDQGVNGMSQTYHRLFGKRLVRGGWRDKERPIVINNWEANRFTFNEDSLMRLAKTASEVGIELFVLDDGWFGNRNDECSGLGDWVPNLDKLPQGIKGLSEKIHALGMDFGLWFEPEMVNKNSDLFRQHPDWILAAPGRSVSHGRNQYVLDFSRKQVVDYVYMVMDQIFRESEVNYVKWDMNRSITECYSQAYPANRQGEIFHRYILGVYDLYERLIRSYPHILFESCASGGGRFDAGMLYYAPQCWTSDDTDAIERLKIQYGTSVCYPVSSMGAHVSAVPNKQVNRITPMDTRANVSYFGAFGYELDLDELTEEEIGKVRKQVTFMKAHRRLLQFGTFIRLVSPFTSNFTAWMVVSEDKKKAIVGYYRILNEANGPYRRLKLKGLRDHLLYRLEGSEKGYYGDELMNAGLVVSDSSAGKEEECEDRSCDFWSKIFVLEAEGEGE